MSTAHDASALTADATATYQRHVRDAASFVRERMPESCTLALIVGTGRDSLPEALSVDEEWTGDDIPHFPEADQAPTTLIRGRLEGTPVLVLDGPLALHEGYSPRQIAFPIRMLGEAGIETLLFTNTAGSVSPEMGPSDLVLVTDHINFQGVNPLVGPNVEDWGPRFPDMSEPYDPALRQRAQTVALDEGVKLQKGVFFAVLGPNLGTQAEYRMVRTLGADLVGTGSVLEVIAARHMDLQVMTLSVIADRCSPDAVEPVATGEMAEALDDARPQLRRLLHGMIASLEDDPVA